MDRQKIRQNLSEKLPVLKAKYHVKQIGIFGSYARYEQTAASDVDILVDFEETPGLLKFIELKLCLSEFLESNVDLVMKNGLKPEVGEHILAEVIYI